MLSQDEENEENKRELRTFSKILGRAFSEPANAESEITEFFLQQRDAESLKEFAKLLDPSTTFSESESLLVILEQISSKYNQFPFIYHLTFLH